MIMDYHTIELILMAITCLAGGILLGAVLGDYLGQGEIDQLKAENKLLHKYYEASQAVEAGVLDFDLQHNAVEQLRKATEALGDKQ